MAHIFISHSSRDAEQASRLLTWMRANGFTETFLDFDKHAGIQPGADWERTLYREVARADAVILILTKNWFDSKWCWSEYTQARALGKAIFPLIEAPTGETFVSGDIQHLDLVNDREGGLERLASELTEVVLNARGGFQWDSKRPPFPGLLAFDEADAAIYFGRDDDIRKLIERLNARRAQGGAKLLAVLGASGSGKSSLLRAGVLPRLKHDKRNWIALPPFRPQLRPLEELAQAVAIALGPGIDWRQWRDTFAAEDFTNVLSDLARDLRSANGANEAQILFTIDQAEELFSAAEKSEAEKFLRVINGLMDERLPFLVVMALRSDYLGKLQDTPALTSPFEEFSLKPMQLARVRDIIEGPAHVVGLTVDDALVSAAMNDAVTDDALPLLAFALRELYDRFGQGGRLTVDAYKALGDDSASLSPLENAVRSKADEVIGAAKPTPEDLQALKDAFVPAMVRVNSESEFVRRPAGLDSLPAKARPLIERLAKARLLVIRKDKDETIVEVAHESLLRKWPLLRGWLDEEREFLIGKDQLEQDLRDWERAPASQKTEALLSGLKLTRARTWLISKPQQLTEAERKFIQNSIAYQDAETARRERSRRRVQQGTIAAALLLAILAGGAIWQLHRITQEQERTVRERDRANRITDFMTSMFKVSNPSESRGNTVTAREILDKASTGINTGLAKDPELQARMMDVMAGVYDSLGLYSHAQTLEQQSLEIRQRVLGPEHRDTLSSMGNLSNVFFDEGHYPEAEKLCRETLDARKRVLGASNRDTLNSMNSLTRILYREGRYPEAEKLDREALDTMRSVLGPEHPDTLKSATNLALVLYMEGRYDQAEKLGRETLEIQRRVLGAEHPETLGSMNNLAIVLMYEGRLAEAEKLDRETLDIMRRVLGPEHSNTLESMQSLATVLANESRFGEAEKLFRETLDIQRRVLGAEHPDTFVTMSNLASVLTGEGRYVEAEKLDRETVDIERRVLGAEHPNTAITTYNLGSIAAHRGDHDGALSLLREAVDHGLPPSADLGLGNDPDLKSLHGDPRFAALVAHAKERAATLQK